MYLDVKPKYEMLLNAVLVSTKEADYMHSKYLFFFTDPEITTQIMFPSFISHNLLFVHFLFVDSKVNLMKYAQNMLIK